MSEVPPPQTWRVRFRLARLL